MKASYKEAGKTRKWLFSVLVAIALVFSFVAPAFMTTQGTAYAEKQREYEIVIYGVDGKTEVGRSSVSSVAGMFNVNARMEPGSNTINFVDAYGQPLENQDNGGFLGMTRFLSYVSPVTVSNTAAITGSDGNPAFTMKVFYEGKEIVTAVSRSSSDENGKRVYAANTMINPNISGNIETSTTNPDGVVVKQDNTTSDSPDPDGKTPKEECITSGAAGSLGWIVCPVMLFLSNSANELYDAVEQYLEVDTDIFDLSGSGGTFEAWQTFQRFANIAFVILFMVVVISQVTGVGINNYGIKKILPKLIVTAILVNISYWICLIVIDISNIVGASIQNLLTGMGPALNVSGTPVAVVGVTLLTALLAGGIAIVLNPAVVLGLLISAIGLVVSLLTLLVLLAARKAIVVVLVVASPIAIVCYMLPNTKRAFDKWVKVAEGMLLLYPTASLLVGAGNFVSRLMMSTDAGQTFFGAFVAILVSIVPIFFIPKLLTSAFAAVGNIGAKVSGIGKNLGGRVQSRVGNSEAFKRTQTRMNAGANRNGEVTGLNKVREKLAKSGAGKAIGLDRTMAAARAQMVKDRYSDQRTGSMVGEGFPAALIEQQKAAEKEELGQFITLINSDTRNGEDEEKLFRMYDDYVAQGNKTGAAAVARIAGRRKDTASRFLAQKITGTGLDAEGRKRLAESNEANSAVFQGVAKEIATGENSGSYRESSPLGFQFAAEHNRNAGKVGEDGKPIVASGYEDWATSENVSRATNNYLTNSKELVGAKNSSLEEIATRMQNGQISQDERVRLQHLAQMTIDNRDKTGVWDTTKETAIYAIAAGGYAGPPRHGPTGEGELDLSGSHGSGSGGSSTPPPTPPTPPAPSGGSPTPPTPPAPSGGNAGGWYDTNNGGGNGANPGAGIID